MDAFYEKRDKGKENPVGYVEYEGRRIVVCRWPGDETCFSCNNEEAEEYLWEITDPMFWYIYFCDECAERMNESSIWVKEPDVEVKPIDDLSEEEISDLDYY